MVVILSLTFNCRLDNSGAFSPGFSDISRKIDDRAYTTVTEFVNDVAGVIAKVINAPNLGTETEHSAPAKDTSPAKQKLSPTKLKRAAAKRIIKAIQVSIEDAIRRESQLLQSSSEDTIHDMATVLDDSLSAQTSSLARIESDGHKQQMREIPLSNGLVNGVNHSDDQHNDALDHRGSNGNDTLPRTRVSLRGSVRRRRTTGSSDGTHMANGISRTTSYSGLGNTLQDAHDLNRSRSNGSEQHAATKGGIPWYMQGFRPEGTTIEEEQLIGGDTVESEELSDMGEEEISGLVADEGKRNDDASAEDEEAVAAKAAALLRKKKAAARRRKRGWT